MKTKSYATFMDGHTEEIFYHYDHSPSCTLFATRSGIYIHNGQRILRNGKFEKVLLNGPKDSGYLTVTESLGIKSITIDDRITYEYHFCPEESCNCEDIRGEVLVSPNADDLEICQAIVYDLNIQYNKKE